MDQVARRIPLIDGVEKITGWLRFTADRKIPGLAHGALLLSPRAHARIVGLDPGDALDLTGVIGLWWHANTPQNGYNSSIWYAGQSALADERMFPPVVRHIGDRVAVVLAETEDIARAALSRIAVTYEDLPSVLSAEAALDHAGPVTDADGPTYLNPVDEIAFAHGDLESAMARADHVAEVTVRTPRSHHCAIEPHVCLAWPEPGGRVAIHSPCQSVFAVQAVVAQALAIDPDRLHVTKAPIGGSFGGKAEPILDPICAFLALRSGRPVRMALNRQETFTSTRTRSAAYGRMRIALAADGRILGRDTEVLVDIGAYCTGGSYLPGSMLQRLVRLYAIPAERYRGRAVYTNTLPTGAFRGYGSPQIHAIGEIALDLALCDMGLDPVAARVRNIVVPAARDPWQNLPLGNARGADCLIQGAETFGWTGRRAERKANSRFRCGVGMAVATHINGCFPGEDEASTATLRLLPNGHAELVCALHDLGCGSDTSLAQIAAETVGLNASDIHVAAADTDTCAYDLGTRASRMTYIVGEAVRQAGIALAAAVAEQAALALNAQSDEIALRCGRATANDRSITLAELAAWLSTRGTDLPAATYTHRATANPGSYAAHFAEVDVDTLTGQVRVTDYLAVHDVGRAINPMLVEGQIHGGIQIGIGYALYEDVAVDTGTGRVHADSFARYTVANAPEMPPVRVLLIEEGEPTGPFGAKAIGEIATIPVAPAIVNAVNHALGSRLTELPLLPDRIVEAVVQIERQR
jgi:CO/xanthine dehydrogenase Mo-binding subunit